ncbi:MULTISPECIES: 4-hydroxyphenylpyruvate dioxygenase [unclassified Undibacterium]|uniref:4-hydroxyphenylpyruvate dioxygenase n=1 Tax=unclassified Undibacterium TaxID=2630295 RepID=UPI002AC96B9B|nr:MULTISPECIES: 4-hydroxyphenylpyruvate dioxygenase [unclassified Undibacterium]MEB0138441.1 4-hydroxyphenylpyruvate dioxygenase [Undibacterium sp. CCC2.1]MEB0171316.1 4-hydroxyphenylpyruvate dioxygenase [Undibacterium sp. CCC1.1]MEB0176447.1 4-hydroxyphenylpyruvate dioxygenase [Undibacterium sp. CCC3.4]MEB0214070.1 4-hydroxyphenylpyruvate dioxygenase [Undibacterium sp. 5I2]WPX43682.1 4-hydroxyphenylpyruvate dioxygenase [Undibacterium sp. CCC3.4]
MNLQQHHPEPDNPLGISGIEFIEYATARPLVFGALLEQMGFVAIARHRSREVTLYRQGSMNIIVNADPAALPPADNAPQSTVISAIALRVRDADAAYRHTIAMGAWGIQTRAGVMELNIPGVHGVGDSILYFVDRVRDFSIYDVDFKALPQVDPAPPALAGMHFFGVVQTIGRERTPEWIDFYQQLMDFRPLPEGRFFGVLPKGMLLESPCHSFYLQLIEPPEGAAGLQWDEQLVRIGIGAPDVPAAVRSLQQRGIVFVDRAAAGASEKGALTQLYTGGICFELVVSHPEHTA